MTDSPTDVVARSLTEHLSTAQAFVSQAANIHALAQVWWTCLANGGALWLCGNGGSAADCQHIAAEMTGRFETERRPLRAAALTVDTSALTAIGNDYGYDQVFSRQLAGLAKPGDVVHCISTSGNSPSILSTARVAKELGVVVTGMTNADGGALAGLCQVVLKVPSRRTARVQEMHMVAAHCCCELIDRWEAGHDR